MTTPRKDYIADEATRRKMLQAYSDNTRGLLRVVDAGSYEQAAALLTEDVTQPLVELAGKMGKALAKVTGSPSAGSVSAAAASIIEYGGIPLISQMMPDFVARGGDMAAAAWQSLRTVAQPLNSAALAKSRAAMALEGRRLAADVEFWDATYRVTAAVASMGLTEATAALDDKLNEMITALGKLNTAYRNAKLALTDPRMTPELAAKLSDFIRAYEDNVLVNAGNTIARGVGITDQQLGLGAFVQPIYVAAAGLATRVGSVVIQLINKIPGPWGKFATGGVAATLVGALVLVSAIIGAVALLWSQIRSLLPSWLGGTGGAVGSSLFVVAVLAGAGYFAYKKGYLAKLGLKPKSA
jgi:hypothetical protein